MTAKDIFSKKIAKKSDEKDSKGKPEESDQKSKKVSGKAFWSSLKKK